MRYARPPWVIFSATLDLLRLVWCPLTALRGVTSRNPRPSRSAQCTAASVAEAPGVYGLMPSVRAALKILKPATVIAWHRADLRAYWRWKSRARGGRPCVSAEVRELIREVSIANPLCGAPRKHGELPQVRYQCRPDYRGKIHDEETTGAVARPKDLPLQSRGRHHRRGHVCRANCSTAFGPAACAPRVAQWIARRLGSAKI